MHLPSPDLQHDAMMITKWTFGENNNKLSRELRASDPATTAWSYTLDMFENLCSDFIYFHPKIMHINVS